MFCYKPMRITGLMKWNRIIFILFIASFSFLIMTVSLAHSEDEEIRKKFFVPPPPFSEGIFPCSQCHEFMEANPNRRELSMHTEIAEGFNHAKEQRWCLDCHNPDDRNMLRLASGNLVSFEESYYLCGQCHGTIFRDWKVGVHGRRTGLWNGRKEYRLCVHCHNPHQPRFKPIQPMPPPIKPGDIKYKKLRSDEIPLNPLGDIR